MSRDARRDPGERSVVRSARREIMVVAGEASGDQHAAHVMEELRRLDPQIRFCGLGGENMKRVGMASVARSEEIAVVGLVEVLRILPRAKRIFDALLRQAAERRPDAVLLVDAPDFNLRLGRRLHELGIPVVYYVSPQLWAWRKGRVHKMRDFIRRMLVLFPFEVPFYEQAGIDVVHVGHPLVDDVPSSVADERDSQIVSGPRIRATEAHDQGSWVLGLLPGSRRSEVGRNLPDMLRAARRLERSVGTRARIILAGSVEREQVEDLIRSEGAEVGEQLEIVDASNPQVRHQAIRGCRACLCASGTATLEVGLLEVPMVVMYRLTAMTHWIAKRLVDLPHVSLVNLVLDKGAVAELIQEDATPEALESEAQEILLDGQARDRMLEELRGLRGALGASGASRRAAQALMEVLERDASLLQIEALEQGVT